LIPAGTGLAYHKERQRQKNAGQEPVAVVEKPKAVVDVEVVAEDESA
jgi:hypothetical protein